jgi:hypothetical protein
MNESMSKRFMVTLPDAVYKSLEDWAEAEGRPVANLAAFLIEMSIRQPDILKKPKDKNMK